MFIKNIKSLTSLVFLSAVFVSNVANAGIINTGILETNLVVDNSSATYDFSTGNGEYIRWAYLRVSIGACSGSYEADYSCTDNGNNSYENEISLTLTNNTTNKTATLISKFHFESGNESNDAVFWLSDIYNAALPESLEDINNDYGYNASDMNMFTNDSDSDWTVTFADSASGDPKILRNIVFHAETSVTPIPEPSIIALMGLGLLGLGFTRRKTKV